MRKIVLAVAFLGLAPVFGQSLNTSFGDSGFVYLPQPVTGQARVRVAVQADGKILLSGSRIGSTNREDYVAGFMPNGTLNENYGNSGYYLFTDAIDDINAAQVFLLSDGSLVCLTDDIASALIKLQPNGTVDLSFTPNAGYANFSTQDFAFTDQDGHLYFIAPATLSNLQRIDMQTGLVDTDFGTVNHTLPVAISALIDTDASAIATADGKFVVLSRVTDIGGDYQCYIKRILPTGELDSSFGEAGKARLYGAPESAADDFDDMYESFANDEAGNLYVSSSNENTIGTTIYKLDISGQPDLNFGTAGKLVMPPDHFVVNTYWHENSLYVLGQKIVSGLNGDMMIAKYDQNGVADAGFGTNGIYVETSNPYYESGETLAFTPDGGIVVAGETRAATRHAFLAKYMGENLSVENAATKELQFINPADTWLTVNANVPVASILLYGTNGQFIRGSSGSSLAVADLPSGLYVAEVTFTDKSTRRIKVLKK